MRYDKRLAALIALQLMGAGALAAQVRDTTRRANIIRRALAPAAQRPDTIETSIAAARVPAAVRTAFARAFPRAVIRGYSSEQKEGRTVYEVESNEGATLRDVTFAADGNMITVEEAVPVAQLPAAVRLALAAQARGGRVTRSERIITMATRDTTFEFAVQGRVAEIKLKKDGSRVE